MSIFHRPENAVLGDVIPFYDEGVFKPFYLRNFRHNRDKDHQDSWVMLATTDHVHFTEHDTNIVGGTGSVIKVDGVYHMFYCTFRQYPERNYINHAISYDLDTWTPIPEDDFRSDDNIYSPTHWRDPFVFWNEEEGCWWMVLAAQKSGATQRQGCVGLMKSDDLHKWRYCEPLYAPMNSNCAFECPDLFKWGDWWYLIYSSCSDPFQTVYRMSKTLEGPWIKPVIDTFDSRCFYAAKTGTDGKRRFIYGWNPTRETDERHFDPQEYPGQDCNTFDWGGNMIVHELFQNEDGTLRVAPVPEVLAAFGTEKPQQLKPLCGEWTVDGSSASVSVPHSYASLIMDKLPKTCRLSMDVEILADTAQLGVALQVDEEFAQGYYVIVDPWRRRVEYKTSVRMTERGGQMFPYEVEMERPLPKETGDRFHVELLIEGPVLEIYVDDRLAMGTRMIDFSGRRWGLFVCDGSARFDNITLYN